MCILEKGAYIGAHILSGNVFNPRALRELYPDYESLEPPLGQPVTQDHFYYLTSEKKYEVPQTLLPPSLHNKGNHIISLSEMCTWLGEQAESMDVDIFTSCSGAEIIYDQERVAGIRTKDMGIGKDGQKKDTFMEGIDILGKQVVLAEGCRGSLSEEVI